ncbi:MAG: hypothetical protein JSS79_13015 [Bacteroidetes bacterium]|nr:hypothetical protein [Bacteroidota bacterium]
MTTVALVHFSAVELYPPVRNLIRELEKNQSFDRLIVLTTAPQKNIERFYVADPRIKIFRLNEFDRRQGTIRRLWNYFVFNFTSLLLLIFYNPASVLYFETLSSFPVFLFKRFFKPRVKLLVHYHEYISPDEFRTGMVLLRWFHQYEKWLYPRSVWVSHTNEFRMELFKQDIAPVQVPHSFILPNYPPASWLTIRKPSTTWPVKIVYIGAFSLKMMYTREFAQWVIDQAGTVIWHVYSSNFSKDANDYLKSLNTEFIDLKPGVDYDKLPEILKGYEVGVILYSGAIPNHTLNVPNKLSEYLSCGLDVWFPSEIKGSLSYCNQDAYPKVMALDFKSANGWILQEMMNKDGLKQNLITFSCEEALMPLIHCLMDDSKLQKAAVSSKSEK